MKKIILTIPILIISLVCFSQLKLIKTDSLSFGDNKQMLEYNFYYSRNKTLLFGKKTEETSDYTFYTIEYVKTKTIGDSVYIVYSTNTGSFVYICEEFKIIMIVSDEKRFIFY